MAMIGAVPSVFARRLKDARLAAGISQERLGVLAGIEEGSASARMNQYERGVHEPKYEMVQRLSRVLEIPVAYFSAEEDWLAELILLAGKLSDTKRDRLLERLRSDTP